MAWAWSPNDRFVLTLPLFHVHGFCAGLFSTLAAGVSAVVFDRFDPTAVMEAVPGSTMFFGVPTMYHRLAVSSGRVHELAGLRLCVSGSAPLAADLWHRLAVEGVVVLERYGMTETLLTLSNPLDGERRPGSVGVPLPGVEAAVEAADEEGVGELLVRGPSLCRGYWGHSVPVEGGWFATGDLVSVADDGYGDGPGAPDGADHLGRPQRVPGRGRGRPLPPSRGDGSGRSGCPRRNGGRDRGGLCRR